VHQNLLNDQLGYENYINKMRSIISMNSFLKRNLSLQAFQLEDSGFVIVNAYAPKLGDIVFINEGLRKMLKLKGESIKGQENMSLFAPNFAQLLNLSINLRVNLTRSTFIGEKQYRFLKNRNGYIVLVEMISKFHFSKVHGYSFLSIISPVQEMKPFSNYLRYSTSQLLFIITDDDEGQITDLSESCKHLINLRIETLTNQDLMIDRPFMRISDLLVDFNFINYKLQRRMLSNEK